MPTKTTEAQKKEPLFHHWLGLLAKRYKTGADYTPEEIHEISNLAMYLAVDIGKEMASPVNQAMTHSSN